MASIPTKITEPADINMTNAADIQILWDTVQLLVKNLNALIDAVNEHEKEINSAVYYKD